MIFHREDFVVSKPVLARRGSGGSGGGAAAPAAGAAAARMGGGPPAPSADRGEDDNREEERAVSSKAAVGPGGVDGREPEGMGYMNEMVAIFGGGKVCKVTVDGVLMFNCNCVSISVSR